MPAIFAHDLFGRKVLKQLPPGFRQIIEAHWPQFTIGLQGPDIFFFYRPFTGRKIRDYGLGLHKVSALPFFEHARQIVRTTGRDTKEYAYLMGFICHFILDSECHPYVAEAVKNTGVHHLEIEEEFDKRLLRLDGKDPIGFPLSSLIPSDDSTARAILPFYRDMSLPVVKQSLKDMKRIKRLLTAPGAPKQQALNAVFRLSGHYKDMKGLMNQRRDNPGCVTTNQRLLTLFQNSVILAATMIQSFDEGLFSDASLDARFNRSFE